MRDVFVLFLLTSVLGACQSVDIDPTMEKTLVTAQAPVSTGYLLSTQQKMQAMHHWDQLADRVAAQGARALDHFFPGTGMAVYVAPAGTTPFAKVYRESLITHLVAYGVPVSFSPEGSVILEIQTELVNHARSRLTSADGIYQTLEPGFTQQKDENGRFKRIPLVAGDSGYFEDGHPNAEIQVTTSMVHQDTYVFRDSSIFYVNETEWHHYQARAPRGSVELKRYSLESK